MKNEDSGMVILPEFCCLLDIYGIMTRFWQAINGCGLLLWEGICWFSSRIFDYKRINCGAVGMSDTRVT